MARKFKFSERPFVLFLGRKVAEAFGFDFRRLGYLWWDGETECAVVPHPSGVNRWWNDWHNRTEASAFLCKAERTRRIRLFWASGGR